MTGVAAPNGIEVPERLVVSVGFGVDAYHGVSHGLVLENIAAPETDGAYLGAFSVRRATRESALFLDAAATPGPPPPTIEYRERLHSRHRPRRLRERAVHLEHTGAVRCSSP